MSKAIRRWYRVIYEARRLSVLVEAATGQLLQLLPSRSPVFVGSGFSYFDLHCGGAGDSIFAESVQYNNFSYRRVTTKVGTGGEVGYLF